MDSATQVDLAKPEAPPEQVLNTALGEAASHLSHNVSQMQRPNGPPKRSSRGSSGVTSQLQPRPSKSSRDPSPSNLNHTLSAKSLELGKFDETANVITLHPVDRGLGAWSYVACAFAMYIVVWGKLSNEARLIYESG